MAGHQFRPHPRQPVLWFVSRSTERGKLTQPRMVFSGEQLSGVFLETIECCRVTLLFPVAIPPPLDPLFILTCVRFSDVVPRLDIPPPRPPETLPTKLLRMIRDVPDVWVFRPPPLIGAELSERVLPASDSIPELRIPPPPTPVVVFLSITASDTSAVAPARFASAPPLPAVFPENLTVSSRRVPAFRMPPPSPLVLPFIMEMPRRLSVPPTGCLVSRTALILLVMRTSSVRFQ